MLDTWQQKQKIRPLAEDGLSTRKIAEETGLSQSTVCREIGKINSGPHPIIQPNAPPPPAGRTYHLVLLIALVLSSTAILIAAAALAFLAWG